MEATNGYALDKKHTFHVCMFTEFDKYAKVADEYAPLPLAPFEPTQVGMGVCHIRIIRYAYDTIRIRPIGPGLKPYPWSPALKMTK